MTQIGWKTEERVWVLCDMVSVNISINSLAYINANGIQYV